eukprot:CAMPEP_0181288558 /NCGR_PEP_ID=MMETSP1101-20121128/398_1 /TAXON_ID=46948 /ORGANISM="Rhodomonas abbreviata, Strain Caron Lab Isolate" /LENGTH=1599 /DNA_ID=CAMNT_0023392691 /DNA_START=371 /DNA_END=5171 /DNA_ORIENTATION=-
MRLRAGKGAKLERFNVQAEHARIRQAGRTGKADELGHYVVRTKEKHREPVRQMLLLEVAEREDLQYVPMDTFVATVKTESVLRIAETAGVEGVYLLPKEMKAPPELLDRLDWRRSFSSAETDKRVWVVLDISLGRCLPSQTDTEVEMAEWESQLRAALKDGSIREIRVGSRRKVSIEVLDSELHGALEWVLEQPQTLWVDQRVPRVSTVKYANEAVIGKRLTDWEPIESISSPVSFTVAAVQNQVTSTPAGVLHVARNASKTTDEADRTRWVGNESVSSPVSVTSATVQNQISSTPAGTLNETSNETSNTSNTTASTDDSSTDGPVLTRQMPGLWKRGLRGQGEIVGVGDTGLDMENCFFHDPDVEAPLCKQNLEEGGVCVPAQGRAGENYKHRKVVGYRMITQSTVGETGENTRKNHGTMVAGVLAGRAQSGDTEQQSFAEQYDGIAPDAKLTIDEMDIGNFMQGGLLSMEGVPTDLSLNFWPWSYGLGARVHVNSWGDSSVFYTHASFELDEFVYKHPDMTIVMAAGNSGEMGELRFSPKNCISVGATENQLDSYSEYRQIDMEVLLEKTPPGFSYYEGMGLILMPSFFGPALRLEKPVRGAVVLVDPPQGTELCAGGFARGLGLKGKIGAMELGNTLRCSQPEIVMEFERQGAIGAVLIFGDGATYQAIDGDGLPVSIPLVYLSQGNALLMVTVLQDVGHNGSLVVSFPTSWKKGERALTASSSRGPTPDGRFKPDVVAPGENIMTTADTSQRNSQCPSSDQENTGLAVGSGTSLAAPLVAGAAALTRQYFRAGLYNGTAVEPSSALIKAMILNSGVGVTYYQDYPFIWNQLQPKGREFSGAVPAFEQGYGRVQLDRVLRFADREEGAEDAFDLHVVDSELLNDGGEYHLCVEMLEMPPDVGRDRPLKVTLVWTDPPASPSSWGLLVNDLDLRVTTPSGDMVLGNGLKSYDTVNLWYDVVDSVNNNEQVSIAENDVEVGVYRVTVTPQDVPEGPQHFALVVTGQRMAVRECSHIAQCPMNCSEIGTCENGVCKCPFSHRGLRCELKNTELRLDEPVRDSIVTGGWNYFYWRAKPRDVWWVMMSVSEAYSDPDMFIAYNRMPTLSDYDGANLYPPGLKTQYFSSSVMDQYVTNETGVWVLGINVYCCYTATINVLLFDSIPEEDSDTDTDNGGDNPRLPVPLETPPADGDPMDLVKFEMSLAVTAEVFRMRRAEYREVVALVTRVYKSQVVETVLYEVGEGRRAEHPSFHTLVGDADKDGIGRQVRQRVGSMGLRADSGRENVERLRVEFSIFVRQGSGLEVARRVSKSALDTELQAQNLPLPLSVSSPQVSAVKREGDQQPIEDDVDRQVAGLADHPSQGMEDHYDHVTPVIISLSCVMLLGLGTFIFVWMRKKGAWAQHNNNAALVFIQSGATPGAPTAPPFVDETAVVRGLCLNDMGHLVNLQVPDTSPHEAQSAAGQGETGAAARMAVAASEEAGEGTGDRDGVVELSNLPAPTSATLPEESTAEELLDRRRVRKERLGAGVAIEMVELGAARGGGSGAPADGGGGGRGEDGPEQSQSWEGIRRNRSSITPDGGGGTAAAAVPLLEDRDGSAS